MLRNTAQSKLSNQSQRADVIPIADDPSTSFNTPTFRHILCMQLRILEKKSSRVQSNKHDWIIDFYLVFLLSFNSTSPLFSPTLKNSTVLGSVRPLQNVMAFLRVYIIMIRFLKHDGDFYHLELNGWDGCQVEGYVLLLLMYHGRKHQQPTHCFIYVYQENSVGLLPVVVAELHRN